MKASVFYPLIIFIFQYSTLFSQKTKPALLQFRSHAFALGVNSNEQPIIGTRMGEVAFSLGDYVKWNAF